MMNVAEKKVNENKYHLVYIILISSSTEPNKDILIVTTQ